MLKCAFFESDITPPLYMCMPGYFNDRPAKDIKDKIYAKAFVAENDGQKFAVVSIEANFITEALCKAVTERVCKNTDISADSLSVSATHIHTGGPTVDWGKLVRHDDTYVDFVAKKAADAVIAANLHLRSARAGFAKGEVHGISFNRIYVMKDGSLQTNPGKNNPNVVKPYAGIDPDVAVIRVDGDDGKPMGAVITFACHCDCVGESAISGDYPSQLSDRLKQMYGINFVTVFFVGTCGNINHFCLIDDRDTVDEYYRVMGNKLADEVLRVMPQTEYGDGTVAVQTAVLKIGKRMVTAEMKKECERIISTVTLHEDEEIGSQSDPEQLNAVFAYDLLNYAKDELPYKEVPVKVMRLGDIAIYCLPGEVFVQFGLKIKAESPFTQNIILTNSNGLFGYIPTEDLFLPNVYESRLGCTSYLEPKAGNMITARALELANALKTGKQVMERRASDNKYLHRDFHVTLDIGIQYVGSHYGEKAVDDYIIRYANSFYKPMTLAELDEYFKSVFAAEDSDSLLKTELTDNSLTVKISECPAMKFMKSIGHTPSEWYGKTTTVLYSELASICGYSFELKSFDAATGASEFVFGRAL